MKRRIITLNRAQVLEKLSSPPPGRDWLLAVDPDGLKASIVLRQVDGFVPDVDGNEDLFPLSMTLERDDGYLEGGDWLFAKTPERRIHDGIYRSYWVQWTDYARTACIREARDFLQMAWADYVAGMSTSYQYAVCFFAQQGSEKYLKAFLAYHGQPVPMIHDIERLLKLCTKVDSSFGALSNDVGILRHYGVDIRYVPDKTQAERDCAAVWATFSKIGDLVRRTLPKTLFEAV